MPLPARACHRVEGLQRHSVLPHTLSRELSQLEFIKSFTVHVDMRANDEDFAPSWTLKYALLQPTRVL